MTGDEATDRAMMASISQMEREAAAEILSRDNLPQYSQRPKLGINSNIYSLYQTKQARLGDSGSYGMSDQRPNPPRSPDGSQKISESAPGTKFLDIIILTLIEGD